MRLLLKIQQGSTDKETCKFEEKPEFADVNKSIHPDTLVGLQNEYLDRFQQCCVIVTIL